MRSLTKNEAAAAAMVAIALLEAASQALTMGHDARHAAIHDIGRPKHVSTVNDVTSVQLSMSGRSPMPAQPSRSASGAKSPSSAL